MACLDVTLEAVEDREARLVWQTDIENDRARHKLLREAQGFLAVPATNDRKPISRDRSRRIAANVSSSSMTNKTRFASAGASRSSSTLRDCFGGVCEGLPSGEAEPLERSGRSPGSRGATFAGS